MRLADESPFSQNRKNSQFSAVLGAGAANHRAALQNSVEQHRDETGQILQNGEG